MVVSGQSSLYQQEHHRQWPSLGDNPLAYSSLRLQPCVQKATLLQSKQQTTHGKCTLPWAFTLSRRHAAALLWAPLMAAAAVRSRGKGHRKEPSPPATQCWNVTGRARSRSQLPCFNTRCYPLLCHLCRRAFVTCKHRFLAWIPVLPAKPPHRQGRGGQPWVRASEQARKDSSWCSAEEPPRLPPHCRHRDSSLAQEGPGVTRLVRSLQLLPHFLHGLWCGGHIPLPIWRSRTTITLLCWNKIPLLYFYCCYKMVL